MDRTTYEQFFIHPIDPWHRRYEVLRAVFVDQQPIQDVAHRFDVSDGTVSNWVSEFRRQCDTGQRPPFSFSRRGAGPVDR